MQLRASNTQWMDFAVQLNHSEAENQSGDNNRELRALYELSLQLIYTASQDDWIRVHNTETLRNIREWRAVAKLRPSQCIVNTNCDCNRAQAGIQ